MRISFETGKNFSAYLAARLIFVTVLLGVAAIFRPAAGNLLTYLALFAANSALSLGGWEWYRQWPSLKLLKGVTLTLAVVLDTLALYYTGGGLNVFMFLYFFSVSAAGLLTGFAGSMWTALLSVGGLIWLEVQRAGMLQPSARMVIFIYGLNLVLTAALASYLFAWFRDREAKHKATLGELKQIRLDTQSILDSVSAGVLVVNADRGVLYSNPSCRRTHTPRKLNRACNRAGHWATCWHGPASTRTENSIRALTASMSACSDIRCLLCPMYKGMSEVTSCCWPT